MTPLETVLVTLVVVWTVLFCMLGIAGFFVVRDLRRILDGFAQILTSTHGLTEDVRAPFAALATAIRDVFAPKAKPTAPLAVPPAGPWPSDGDPAPSSGPRAAGAGHDEHVQPA